MKTEEQKRQESERYVRLLVYKDTKKRLKVSAAKAQQSLIGYLDELSRIKL